MIGKLERVPLREVWKNEATDFTRWLQENIDVLNEVLDFTLSNPEREQAAGAFSVDLVAEDESGSTVIIENQLEKSDHDHLGKLITYLTSFGAKAAIWVVAKPRPEHVNAISWLNESSSANFYLIQVEAVCIEGSPPAPLLTLIVGPSEESKGIGEKKKELAERHVNRRRFWEQLLDTAKRAEVQITQLDVIEREAGPMSGCLLERPPGARPLPGIIPFPMPERPWESPDDCAGRSSQDSTSTGLSQFVVECAER